MAKKTATRVSPTRSPSTKVTARDLPKKATKGLAKKTGSKTDSPKKAAVVAAPPRKAKTAPKGATAPTRPKIEKTSPKKKTTPKKTTPAIHGDLSAGQMAAIVQRMQHAAASPELKEKPAVQPPLKTWTGGAIVGGTDPCTCGDAPEEHGRDPRYPGSTRCNAPGCVCVAYEADPEDSETATPNPESHEAAAEAGPESPKTHTSDPGFGEEDSGDEDHEY